MLRAGLGLVTAALGDFEEGIALGKQAIREAEASQHPFSILYAVRHLILTYLLRGFFSDSEALADREFALATEHAFAVMLPAALHHRGYVYTCSGRIAEGVTLLEQAHHIAESAGPKSDLVLITLALVEAYVAAGKLEQALERATEALRLARERNERAFEAFAIELLADIAASRIPCDFAEAEASYLDALRRLEVTGPRSWLARCHLSLGTLYRKNGRREAARKHLTMATAMLADMGMHHWLESAHAETQELG